MDQHRITAAEARRREMIEGHLRDASLKVAKYRTNRRSLLKGAVGGAAAMAMAAGVTPGFRPKYTLAQEPDAEQIFYNYAFSNDPLTFDFNANLYAGAEVECWAGLLTFNTDGEAVADWAYEWDVSDDASLYTFRIREDNNGWSNGDPVTAHDFVWSFARLLSPEPEGAAAQNVYNFILFDIKNAESFSTNTPIDDPENELNGQVATADDLGLRAIDDWTLEVTLEGPVASFLQKVGYVACVPAHRPSVEEYGERWALAEEAELVSSGPFKLDAWEKGVRCVLSKNEGYWNAESVSLQTVIDPIIPGANLVTNYESGTGDQRLDWTPVSGADVPRFLADEELASQIEPYTYPGIWMLLPSNGVAPFDDLNVRKALGHAIDRDRLATVTNGLVLPAHCMVPPGVYGFFDDPDITAIQAFDPEMAMSYLEDTPYAGGQNWPAVTILMRSDEEQFNSDIMINDIVAQLEENLGLSVQIEELVEANFRPRLYENRDQLVWIRWWYDYPDPDNGYFDMFYGAKPSNKRQAWENAEFDQVIIEGKAILDPDERLAAYIEAERIIKEDVGYMPIVFRVDYNAFKPWVTNIPQNSLGQSVPDGNIYVRAMTEYVISGRPE